MTEMCFTNLLEYAQFSLKLRNNIKDLREFGIGNNINLQINSVKIDFENYRYLIIDYLTSLCSKMRVILGNEKEDITTNHWLDFDKPELDILLKNDIFFNDYSIKNSYKELLGRPYPGLEMYIFYKLQSLSTDYLTYEETANIANLWLLSDKIEEIYNLGWYGIIANVYKNFGVHWFYYFENYYKNTSNSQNLDPILFKWSIYAILSGKKSKIFPLSKIKQDLLQLYSEILISFSIRNISKENMDIIDLAKESILNFDDTEFTKLNTTISSLEKDKIELIDKNKQLNEGLKILKNQISELQKSEGYDDEKIEKIVYQIYCLSPQTSEYENKLERFKSIWTKLSDSTKKDIKQSITMFEQFDSIDLAIFPLLRSLEHELVRNYFQPFHQSSFYLDITEFICSKKKYELTHKCLIKNGNEYPTIGSIPFIGRSLENDDALNSSNLLNSFALFLADKKVAFCSICKNIDTYSIGSKKLKLVNIRNGIAHGDLELTESIDKECYSDITTMLYEPPVRILFEIIENTKKEA